MAAGVVANDAAAEEQRHDLVPHAERAAEGMGQDQRRRAVWTRHFHPEPLPETSSSATAPSSGFNMPEV